MIMMKFKTLNNTNQFWFTSDVHAYHKNITRGVSEWQGNLEESTRDFATTVEMTEHMIMQINKHVKHDHYLFLLGDLVFKNRSPESYLNLINRLECNNIYILFGNHDNPENIQYLLDNELTDKIKFVGYYLEIEIDGKMLCLMHYPLHSWNNRNKDSWMIHGHEHGRINKNQVNHRLDVGLDSAKMLFNEYKPFNWKEIIKILS